MTSFRGLTADRRPLQAFKNAIPSSSTFKRGISSPTLPLHVFAWSLSSQDGIDASGIRSVDDLENNGQSTVRVVFAPRDVPTPETVDGMSDLFEKCKMPSAFIAESLQGVSQSFSVQKDVDGTLYIWFHFLCKDIAVQAGRIVHIHEPGEKGDVDEDRLRAQTQSQANFTWLKPGFLLRIRERKASSPRPHRTTTNSSDSTLAAASNQTLVEMFCFGAPISLRDRFLTLKNTATCDDILRDPYVFLEVAMSEMYQAMDRTGLAIGEIFGQLEIQTLGMASTPGKATKELRADHFTSLHNLAKHTIYLRENCESALATLDALREHHRTVIGHDPNACQEATQQLLTYQKTLFQSTQRKLSSLDKRMANIIQLSFHIVTQGDSRLMQSENQSMKTIAVMTLIFMPLSTVASIFGTQFMKLQEGDRLRIEVSSDFWLLWLIATPLTIIVLIFWRVWYRDARGRLVDEIPRRSDGERGYMGWKSMQQKVRETNKHRKEDSRIVERELSADGRV